MLRYLRLAAVLLALGIWGCATAYCPDDAVGLGNSCGQGKTSSTTAATTSGSSGNGATVPGSGQLYAVTSGAISRFSQATTAAGNVSPTAVTQGALTQLQTSGYLAIDTANDRLYVPSAGNDSILVFDGASKMSGNVAPTRVISGTATQLSRPVQIELDSAADALYVASSGSNSVLVFANASSAQGNVAPARTLGGGTTRITAISSLHLEKGNDRLWVVDPTANALLVFESASSLNGAPAPSRTISGSNTELLSPQYLAQVGSTLFVSCTSSIVRFQGSDALSGNVAPAASVKGRATNLSVPGQLVYKGDSDELYVADSGGSGIFVFARASTATGALAPARILRGSNTGLSNLRGLVFDLSR